MKTILLIDDDEQVRRMFGLALRKAGYHIIEADSGVSGLAVARQHLPDLILSDVHMPGGDGSTLLRDIRRDPALNGKQVVLMTGRPDLATPRAGMEDGADDFLTKPVGIKDLLNCVKARFSRASISWRVEDQHLINQRSTVPSHLPHEFFTPLAGILGLMDILRDPNAGLSSEEVHDIHNDIHESALRLHRTLRNYLLILDLETSSSTEPAKPPAPLSIGELKQSVAASMNEVLRGHKRESDLHLHIDPCPIAVRPDDLTRIVEEIANNACKFSRPGTPVEITLGADGVLTVTDQGRGMSSEQINNIGAFQQFDRKKHEQQGLGLGLVLAQKLAAQNNAPFSITSQPGQGTKVQVAFPTANHQS
jgi:signal transduction histidine kinase